MNLLTLAQDTTTEVVGDGDVFSINALGMMIIVSLVTPVINGLLFKAGTPTIVKELGLIALNYVGNAIALSTMEDGTGVFSREVLITTGIGWAIATLSYLKLYKPVGVTNTTNNPTGRALLGVNKGL